MSLQQSLDLLQEIERDYPVNEWSAEGVRLWPLIRTHLSYLSSQPHLGRSAPPRFREKLRKVSTIVDAIVAPLRDRSHHLPFAAPAGAFMLTYSFSRQARLQSGHYDTFLGPIQQLLEERQRRCHIWEFSHAEPYRYPRATASHLIEKNFLKIHLRQALRAPRLGRVQLPRYEEASAMLRKRDYFYPMIDADRVLREFGHILMLKDLFARALDIIRPEIAFTSNVGRFEMGLYLACLERGILAVEVQHGVQGGLHGQYARWTCPPAEGYELLPGAYWSWNADNAATINAWSRACAPRHRAIPGGTPWFDYCNRVDPAEVVPRYADQLKPDPLRKVALITLQPAHLIYEDHTMIPGSVLDAMKRQGRSCTWWIRFHPMMQRDDNALRSVLRQRGIDAELDVANDVPLALLLRRADLHLTHSSSTVIEAERFGIPSIVWSEYGASVFGATLEAGHAVRAASVEELDAAIRRAFASGRYPPRREESSPLQALDEIQDLAVADRQRFHGNKSAATT